MEMLLLLLIERSTKEPMLARSPVLLFLCFSFLQGSCASSQSAVPDVRAKHLSKPSLPGISPRNVVLEVIDARDPAPPQSGETVETVYSAVEGALAKSEVLVVEESPNELTVTLEYPEELPPTFTNPFHCVLARTHIEIPGGKAESWSTSCFHSDDALGFPMGTDSTDAFRSALKGSLQGLDRKLSQLFRDRKKRS